MDIFIQVPRVKVGELEARKDQMTTKEIIHTVETARLIQKERFAGTKLHRNAEMSNVDIDNFAKISDEARKIAISSTERLHLSTRVYYRILRVGRTIADISGSTDVEVPHILEALSYRGS